MSGPWELEVLGEVGTVPIPRGGALEATVHFQRAQLLGRDTLQLSDLPRGFTSPPVHHDLNPVSSVAQSCPTLCNPLDCNTVLIQIVLNTAFS